MLEDKRVLTEGEKPIRVLSQFRVVILTFTVGFFIKWPASWDWPTWAALTTIVLALPVRDFAEKVPVSEGLAALTAVFQGIVAKKTAQVAEHAEAVVDPSTDGGQAVG